MRAVRPLVLCSIGGLLYVLCELVFRGAEPLDYVCSGRPLLLADWAD